MSFPIDPPWLYAYAALAPKRAQGRAAAAVGAGTHAASAALFASHPLRLGLGRR